MSYIARLPYEIRNRIIGSLPRSSILQCMLLSKRWYDISLGPYYTDLVLNQKILSALEQSLLQTQTPDHVGIKNHGCLVKTLTIERDTPHLLKHPHHILGKILSYTPFIKRIDLSSSSDPVPYLYNLNRLEEKVNLFHLEELRVFSTYTLSLYNSNRMKTHYLGACYIFRSTLKYLELVEPRKAYTLGDQPNLTYLGVLALFKKLTHLILHYNTEERIQALSVYAEVFNACPKLHSFDYICDGIKNSAAPGLQIHPSLCINKIPIQTYPKSSTNTKLTSLSLDLPSFDKHQIEYITNIIPAEQLIRCELSLNHADTFKYWAADINTRKVKKLAKHLNLAKNLLIRVKQGCVDPTKKGKLVHQSESTKNALQLESLVKFVNALQGNKRFCDYKVNVELDVKKREGNFQQISEINTTITKKTLGFHQTIDTVFFKKTKHNILTAKFANGDTLASKITTLSVSVSQKDVTKVLKFVLKRCQKLEQLGLHVGDDKREIMITIPGREKNTFFFPTPQRVRTTLSIDYNIASHALLCDIFNLMPELDKLFLKNVKRVGTTDPLLDFNRATCLTELFLEFEVEDPLFCVQLKFHNADVAEENTLYSCVAISPDTSSSRSAITNSPRFTIWHKSIQKATVYNRGDKIVYFFPPFVIDKSKKCFLGSLRK